MAAIQRLKIAIKTSADAYAGTDAAVYLTLCTPAGGHTYQLPTEKEHLEAGQTDIYTVALADAPGVSALQHVILSSGMDGRSPAWKILWVKIDALDATGRSWRIADTMLERWLQVKEGYAPLAFVPLKRPCEDLGATDVVGAAAATLARIP